MTSPYPTPDATPEPAPRRAATRARSTGLNLTLVLAVLLPVLTLGGTLLVHRSATPPAADTSPTLSDLSSAFVVCPTAIGKGGGVVVTAPGAAAGTLSTGVGAKRSPVNVTPGTVTPVDAGAPATVVTGRGASAPGLVAGRSSDRPLAALDCAPTAPEQWFTGVGAGATHQSTLELVNPNDGPAVADVTVYSATGMLDIADLRGVAVPGGSTRRLDLAALAPRRGELALHVVTQRGRISATVEDGNLAIGVKDAVKEWLPGQSAPATDQLLLGLPQGGGSRSLVLANPGTSEVRADISLVTDQSIFSPKGVDTVRVPPQSIARVVLSDVLGSAIAKGTTGLEVKASGPITAGLRSLVGSDLVVTTAGELVSSTTTVLLPAGNKQVVLAGASAKGTATLTARSADGVVLFTRAVDLTPGRGTSADLPPATALLTVTPTHTSFVGSVLITSDQGAAVVRMRELVRQAEVPHVAPGP